VPEVLHRHKHIKTKFVHVFHPKVVHHDHSSIQFLHSRRDPNVAGNAGIVNGGYPQPLINMNKPELRITEDEFNKWRKEQMKKIYEDRKRQYEQDQRGNEADDEEEDEEEVDEPKKLETEETELYKKHKANKANSSRGSSKHKNHNYSQNQDFEASNSDKTYANYPSRQKTKKKSPKASPAGQSNGERSRKKQPPSAYRQQYGYVNLHEAQASNVRPQYFNMDPTSVDPSYYSTIPKDASAAASDNQDEIYSGLLSTKYTRLTADKSKLLGDLNYNRKQQAKSAVATASSRKSK
jgi:hypothetical protein